MMVLSRLLFRIRLGVFCIFLGAAAVTAWGAEATEPKWSVIGECQMVVVPQKAVLPLLGDLVDDSKVEAVWTQIRQLIGRNEASLAASLVVRGETETELKAESVEEMRYPVEFDPPQLPATFPKDPSMKFLKAWPVVGITPTAFDTRKVGTMLEVTASVSKDGQRITASVTSEHVRFLRNLQYDAGNLASGDKLKIEQPLFSNMKNSSSLYLRSGQWVLMAMHKVPAKEDEVELFFLRIRTQKAGASR